MYRIFISLPVIHTIVPTGLSHHSPAPHYRNFKVVLICIPKCPSFSAVQIWDLSRNFQNDAGKQRQSDTMKFRSVVLSGVYLQILLLHRNSFVTGISAPV